MKFLLLGGAAVLMALLLAVLVVYLIGRTLPVAHTASVTLVLSESPEIVWARIGDFPGQKDWRPGLRSVERVADRDGLAVWRETSGGELDLATVEARSPLRLVRRIVGEGLPFGGTWTTVLTPDGRGGTKVMITEDGEVYSPIFRFVSRYVMGHEATLRQYARDLRNSFPKAGTEVSGKPKIEDK